MNQFLANLYGTGADVGTNMDIEKLAEAQVIDEQLRSEGIDVNQLSGEDVLKCAYALFGDESAIVKSAEEGSEEESEEEEKEESTEEKVAEADFLGRVMAHSFYQEKGLIEKQAASPKATRHLSRALHSIGEAVSPKRVSHMVANRKLNQIAGKMNEANANVPRAMKEFKKKHLPKHMSKYYRAVGGGTVGLGALGLGGAGVAAGRASKD